MPNVMDAKDRRMAELERLLKATLETIAQLEAKIALLKKHSGNSSQPPSSDIIKPSKDKDRRRKKNEKAEQKRT